jgi:hypothetical protein
VKLYAQHGWGKGDKIDRALENGHIAGVILSPHDEHPSDLGNYVSRLAGFEPAPDVMIDPQLYVSLLNDPNEGKLPLYDYYRSNLGLRDFTARTVQSLVRAVIDFQRRMAVTHIISPTVIQEGFTHRSSQVAHSLAEESIEYWESITNDNRPLLVSAVFTESALMSHDQVAEWLDTISLYAAEGFYLVVERNTPLYSQGFDSDRMAELLKMIYSLARARFRVISGYSDFIGVNYAAVGAVASASGWSQKLRRFNRSRFLPSRGGRQPRDRYSAVPLLNSIFLAELDACQDAGRLRAVKSRTPYDAVFDGDTYPSGISWTPETSTLHHWASLARLYGSLARLATRDRLQRLSELITRAGSLYSDLARRGVTFEAPNGPAHLGDWADALGEFRRALRL